MSNRSKVELMDMHKKDRELLNKVNQHIKVLNEQIKKQGQELARTGNDLATLYQHSKNLRDILCKDYPEIQLELCSEIAELDMALDTVATAKPRKLKLFILVIDNKGGTCVSVYKSEQERQDAIYDYMAQLWKDKVEPDDDIEKYAPKQAIEHYFHEIPFVDEWHVLQDVSLQF